MRHYRSERRASRTSLSSEIAPCRAATRGSRMRCQRPAASRVIWILAAALWGASFLPRAAKASGAVPPIGSASLEGRVRTSQGGAAPVGTTITLETMNGEIAVQTVADSSGGFQIQGLQRIKYVLTVKASGFETYRREIDLRYASTVEFADVTLQPASTIVERRAPPALTDLQAPKEARKDYEKGHEAIERRDAKKAERYLESAVEIYPCYARAQTDLGLTLSSLGKFDEAEKALRKAVECDPGFPDSYPVLGQLLNAEKNYAESEAVLEKGLRLSPGAWQFYAELGTAEFGQGKYQNAAQDFQKAEQMTPPPPPDIHVKLANAYVKMQSFNQAYGEMAAYLNAAPHGEFAPRVKEIMGQMKAAGVIHQ